MHAGTAYIIVLTHIFFHPDYTVGPGISPESACTAWRHAGSRTLGLLQREAAGRITASEELHLALKQNPWRTL